jgi:multisubunit Na+/H+ antiporter MnhF subunit
MLATDGIEMLKFLSKHRLCRMEIALPVDIDFASIVLMEFFGVVSFVVALIFFRQRQRVRNKQKAFVDALNRRLICDKGDGMCFSSEWVMDNIVYPRKKVLNSTPLLLMTLTFLIAFFYYVVGPRIVASLVGLGYASVIALLAIVILLWTDALEAYSYSNAINQVSILQLDIEDQSYMELARDGLERACVRFVSLGVAFALLGPSIPLIFNGVVYAFVLYAAVFFKTSEVLFNVFTVLGAIIVFAMPLTLFFLPELVSRVMARKVKPLADRILARKKG